MLKTTQILQTIRALIEDNATDILDGIIVSGVQREFEHITTSPVTPPTGYYFVAIDAEPISLSEDSGPNVLKGNKIANYGVVISIVDYIYGVRGETELYETMHNQFRDVADRLQELIYDQDTFISPDTTHKYTLVDFDVDRNDLSTSWEDSENYQAVVGTEIRFELEECIV